MIPLNSNPNVDNSDLANFPDGRIRDNDGTNNGTSVNRAVYGDIHSTISKLMRLYGIIPNGLPDSEGAGYQIIDALRALASKNDFIYPLSTNGTILSVDIKFSQMLDNEYIVCLVAFNKGVETQIKGVGAGVFPLTYSGNFKANEYVRVIKTSAGVSIIRLADAISLDSMAIDAGFLKKATQAQENDGLLDSVATTPLVNLVAFIRRINGADSGNYLAVATGVGQRNGLLSSADKAVIDGLGANKIRNTGFIDGIDVASGTLGQFFARGGDVVSAQLFQKLGGNSSTIRIVLANTMTDTNYFVLSSIQSNSADMSSNNNLGSIVFFPVNATTFDLCIEEFTSNAQNIKIHIQAVKI